MSAPRDHEQTAPVLPGGPRFAVVDLETTGLDPNSERVIECAILHVNAGGEVEYELSTLVSIPGSDEPGAQFVHGITRAMLANAPPFGALCGLIASKLEGRVIVGHVVAFDLGHLYAEFARTGHPLPDLSNVALCTRELTRPLIASGPRSLTACCARAGITIEHPHTALGDAWATAKLLRWALTHNHSGDVDAARVASEQLRWPRIDRFPVTLTPRR